MNTSIGQAERVALYARISEDATGEAAGVDRQMRSGRELAEVRGWHVVAEVSDNDISALRGKHRPGYAEVLRMVRAGEIDHVVVWQTSRLLRNRRERAEAIELFGQQRVGIIAVKGISFDLSTAYGRGQAGLLGEFDTMESEVKSERILEAAADRAQTGRPSGSLGYGWEKAGVGVAATYTEHAHEGDVVREIVDRLLSGESLRAVTESLNARGEPAPNSEAWGKTSVKKLALRESNIAVRLHHRGRPDEERFEGAWPALVDRAKHEKITALLAQPDRQNNGAARPGAREHLLSWGIGECGVCGGLLRVVTRRGRYGKAQVMYACDAPGCVGRNEAAVDELVREVVIARLQKPDALDWLLGDDDTARRLSERADELRRRLEGAADAYAEGDITRQQLQRITAKLTPDLDAAEQQHRAAVVSLDLEALCPLAGPAARERWDEMHVSQRRAVLETLGVRVFIDRVTRRGPGFDPESVRIDWNRATR